MFPCSSIAFFHALKNSVIRCLNIKGCYDLLINWLLYHYEITHYLIRNTWPDSNRAIPTLFRLTLVWYISFHPFTLMTLYLQ